MLMFHAPLPSILTHLPHTLAFLALLLLHSLFGVAAFAQSELELSSGWLDLGPANSFSLEPELDGNQSGMVIQAAKLP